MGERYFCMQTWLFIASAVPAVVDGFPSQAFEANRGIARRTATFD